MADFDWHGTCEAAVATGGCNGVIVLDTEGTFHYSFPLDDAGNYKNNLWGGPDYSYAGKVTQEDGSETEETVDEIDNIVKLATGRKAEIPKGVGLRIDQKKYMHINTMKGEQESITVDGVEDEQDVTLEEVHILRQGTNGCIVALKGGYIFMALHDAGKPEQQFPSAIKALCHVAYWAVGPDPEE